MISKLKEYVEKHSSILKFTRYIPYSLRLGREYSFHTKLINRYLKMNGSDKENFHYLKIKNIKG